MPFKLPDFIEKTGISKLRDINVNGAAMVLFFKIDPLKIKRKDEAKNGKNGYR